MRLSDTKYIWSNLLSFRGVFIQIEMLMSLLDMTMLMSLSGHFIFCLFYL